MRFIMALAAAALLLAGPTFGQAATPPSTVEAVSEKDRLGAEVWRILIKELDVRGQILKWASTQEGRACPAGSPPNCPALVREAVLEGLDAGIPQLELSLGRKFAAGLTEPQVSSGLALLSRPDVRASVSAAFARRRGAPEAAPFDPAIVAFATTPDGRAFLAGFAAVDFRRDAEPLMDRLFDNIFARFETKLAAAKAAR